MNGRLSGMTVLAAFALSACGDTDGLPGDTTDTAAFDAVGAGDTVRFAGRNPDWSGEARADRLSYRTADMEQERSLPVTRFAGRGGMALSGMLEGQTLDLAISRGDCSITQDGPTRPFIATLRIGDAVQTGCAWIEEDGPGGA